MAFFHRYHRQRLTFSLICFDCLITHECDLMFGSLSSLEIQTQYFVFLPFDGCQGDSGPFGGLPAPKTTTSTTLRNTVMTTTKTMTTIAGWYKWTHERSMGATVTWDHSPTQWFGMRWNDGVVAKGGRADFFGRPQRGPWENRWTVTWRGDCSGGGDSGDWGYLRTIPPGIDSVELISETVWCGETGEVDEVPDGLYSVLRLSNLP